MKVLSMSMSRLQDRIDAQCLLRVARPDLAEVRENLALISARGWDRGEDLDAKLAMVLEET